MGYLLGGLSQLKVTPSIHYCPVIAWALKEDLLSLVLFHWRVQNVTIPCRSQELLPFLSVIYFFLPAFSNKYSSILSHLILPSISWSISQNLVVPRFIYNTFLGILFSSILCTCPNQRNLFNHIVSIIVGFLTIA